MVYHVGTVGSKHWLYSRLSTDADKTPEARLTHFTDQLPSEYFPGLVSETYDPSKNRFINRRGARNEPLDTWVYAYAAAHHPEVRLHRLTKSDWDSLQARLSARAPAATTPIGGTSIALTTAAGSKNVSTPDPILSPPKVNGGRISISGLRR